MQKYLLEKSRIVSQARNERNYHVFYYLLEGASDAERQHLHLLPPAQYRYLSQVRQLGRHELQYADDTQVLISGKKDSLPQLIASMEQTLDSLDIWFHSHGLKVNTGKTELLVCGSRQNCLKLAPVTVRFREDVVCESPGVRNLGVVFDKHLTWDSHISALVKKCNGILIGLSTCAIRSRLNFSPPWSMPWSSRTSDTVLPSMETGPRTACNACKKS